jgi:ADP-ribosylglycohydrolase
MSAKEKALASLRGVSVGDALGERFFGPDSIVLARIKQRRLPKGPWPYTDDTEMAISIVQELLESGTIAPTSLANRFAKKMSPRRGYGRNTLELLQKVKAGGDWEHESKSAFGGRGSYGNGAAMRAAPIGAFFGADTKSVIANATAAAKVTHYNTEAIAGAVAVSLAASYHAVIEPPFDFAKFVAFVSSPLPESETKNKICRLTEISDALPIADVVKITGNGSNISAQDTVPFVIWIAGHYFFNYTEAFWHCVQGLGDRDTTCAMVGGIVGVSTRTPIPKTWVQQTEDALKSF